MNTTTTTPTSYYLIAPLVINYPRRIRNRERRRIPVLAKCTARKRRTGVPPVTALRPPRNSQLSSLNK